MRVLYCFVATFYDKRNNQSGCGCTVYDEQIQRNKIVLKELPEYEVSDVLEGDKRDMLSIRCVNEVVKQVPADCNLVVELRNPRVMGLLTDTNSSEGLTAEEQDILAEFATNLNGRSVQINIKECRPCSSEMDKSLSLAKKMARLPLQEAELISTKEYDAYICTEMDKSSGVAKCACLVVNTKKQEVVSKKSGTYDDADADETLLRVMFLVLTSVYEDSHIHFKNLGENPVEELVSRSDISAEVEEALIGVVGLCEIKNMECSFEESGIGNEFDAEVRNMVKQLEVG